MYAVIVFRSRTETLGFSQILKSYGVKNTIINTPRQANVSCGISVKVSFKDVNVAKSVLSRRKFNTFAGFYMVDTENGSITVRPL